MENIKAYKGGLITFTGENGRWNQITINPDDYPDWLSQEQLVVAFSGYRLDEEAKQVGGHWFRGYVSTDGQFTPHSAWAPGEGWKKLYAIAPHGAEGAHYTPKFASIPFLNTEGRGEYLGIVLSGISSPNWRLPHLATNPAAISLWVE